MILSHFSWEEVFQTQLEELIEYPQTFFIIIPEDDLCMTARSCWLLW